MRVLVLQHIACEPPGAYEDVLRERGARIHRVELDEAERLPERVDVDPEMRDHARTMFGRWMDTTVGART